MKLRKKIKRFWTLDVHNHEGFTLVELIIVIAILAILSSVAVVGYSSYVKKANMQADKTMIAEIANALTLHYYSNIESATSDYVILVPNSNASTTTSDDDEVTGFAEAALIAAYGENWAEVLLLKYTDWTDDGMLDYVLDNKADSAIVAGTSYLANNTPAQLVNSISNLTDALSGMAATASRDPLITMETMQVLTADEVAEIRAEMNALKLSWDTTAGADNSAYSTALSNILVKYVSTEVSVPGAEVSGLSDMAVTYALLYGWAATDAAGQKALEDINAVIANEESDTGDILDAFGSISAAEGSPFYDYITSETAQYDYAALPVIMGAVNDITADYDMIVAGIFSADSIGDEITNYVNAVVAVSSLTDAELTMLSNLPDGAVVIFVGKNGEVSVLPAAAYPVG